MGKTNKNSSKNKSQLNQRMQSMEKEENIPRLAKNIEKITEKLIVEKLLSQLQEANTKAEKAKQLTIETHKLLQGKSGGFKLMYKAFATKFQTAIKLYLQANYIERSSFTNPHEKLMDLCQESINTAKEALSSANEIANDIMKDDYQSGLYNELLKSYSDAIDGVVSMNEILIQMSTFTQNHNTTEEDSVPYIELGGLSIQDESSDYSSDYSE